MIFNSLSFGLFFIIVFLVYWFIFPKNLKAQNIFLLLGSYFFYGSWNWHFLFLLIFSTLLDYFSAHKIAGTSKISSKKMWLAISISINLGFLAVFKYYNFFTHSMSELLMTIGFEPHIHLLQIILPVGISFYTFHGVSYIIDVYYDRLKPVNNLVDYSLFVSFFPLLVAGPIERATHLLPQIQKPRTFDYQQGVSGLRQILWGLFKKVVIADNCAEAANGIFNNYTQYSGLTLAAGAFMFAIQIYCDFSGYSDIALGTARLLGIDLLQNFSFPYFSRNIPEFWRRWHISLSSWFRDYVYIPLGGSRNGLAITVRNTFAVFLLSGIWHGANWTFIFWGVIHALLFLPFLFNIDKTDISKIVAKGRLFPSIKEFFQVTITFTTVTFTWIFFRATSLQEAFGFIGKMYSGLLEKSSYMAFINSPIDKKNWLLVLIFFLIEWIGRDQRFALEAFGLKWAFPLRWIFYIILIYTIFRLNGSEQQFIYFQF